MAINLLPQELKPKGYSLKLSKVLKKVAMVSVSVFLVTASVVGAGYLLLRNRTSASTKKQDELKMQIKAMEQSEQKLVLIKDRIQKIGIINTADNITQEIDILEDVLKTVHEGVFIRDVELQPSDAKVLIVTGRSLDLSRFLVDLTSNYEFVKIELVSFDYTPTKGYEMKLSLVR